MHKDINDAMWHKSIKLPWCIRSSNDCSEENQVCERGDCAFIFHPFVLAVVFSWGHVSQQMPTPKLNSRGKRTVSLWKMTGKVNHLLTHPEIIHESNQMWSAIWRSPDPAAQSMFLRSPCILHGEVMARNTFSPATATVLFWASEVNWNSKFCLILRYSSI